MSKTSYQKPVNKPGGQGPVAMGVSADRAVDRLVYDPQQITYYDILRVRRCAPLAEVKMAYHKLVRAVHPDSRAHHARDPKYREQAEAQLRLFNQAYAKLSHEPFKTAYDRKLMRSTLSRRRVGRPINDNGTARHKSRAHSRPLGRRFSDWRKNVMENLSEIFWPFATADHAQGYNLDWNEK